MAAVTICCDSRTRELSVPQTDTRGSKRLQKRKLEKKPACACVLSCFSCVRLFATLWTVACQAPLYMGFSRQEYWSELPFPSPGDLPYPGIKPKSPALQTDSLPSEAPGKPISIYTIYLWVYKLIYHEGFRQEGR